MIFVDDRELKYLQKNFCWMSWRKSINKYKQILHLRRKCRKIKLTSSVLTKDFLRKIIIRNDILESFEDENGIYHCRFSDFLLSEKLLEVWAILIKRVRENIVEKTWQDARYVV